MGDFIKVGVKKTPEIIAILEDAFRMGAHVYEACEAAGINRQTYYNWVNSSEEFAQRMYRAQEWVTEIAKSVVAKRITRNHDPETAKWWLERKLKKEFSLRTELSGPEGGAIPLPLLANIREAQPAIEGEIVPSLPEGETVQPPKIGLEKSKPTLTSSTPKKKTKKRRKHASKTINGIPVEWRGKTNTAVTKRKNREKKKATGSEDITSET